MLSTKVKIDKVTNLEENKRIINYQTTFVRKEHQNQFCTGYHKGDYFF